MVLIDSSIADDVQRYQINYKGQTSILQSLSDVAAWVEERKRRYPIRARASEFADLIARREETQKAPYQERKNPEPKHRNERNDKQVSGSKDQKNSKKDRTGSEDVTTRAKRKVEKLRRELEIQEELIARAEAQPTKHDITARDRGPSAQTDQMNASDKDGILFSNHELLRGRDTIRETVTEKCSTLQTISSNKSIDKELGPDLSEKDNQQSVDPTPGPLAPTSLPQDLDDRESRISRSYPSDMLSQNLDTWYHKTGELPGVETKHVAGNNRSDTDPESDLTSLDSEDLTSSSGSSVSDRENGRPDQVSSKRNGPVKLAPPERGRLLQVCRQFHRHGHCKWGDACNYRHELPTRDKKAIPEGHGNNPKGRKQRISLYQRVSSLASNPRQSILTS